MKQGGTAVSSVEASHTDASFGKSNNPLEEVCMGFGSQEAPVLSSCVSKPWLPSSSVEWT